MTAQRQPPKGKTGAADQAVAWIGKLYLVEPATKDATEAELYRARQAQAVPILKQLRRCLEKTQPRTAPKTANAHGLRWGLSLRLSAAPAAQDVRAAIRARFAPYPKAGR